MSDHADMELHLVLKVRELQQIIIGQQRLIELQERKIQAAEKVGEEMLAIASWPKMRSAIHAILDAIQGMV